MNRRRFVASSAAMAAAIAAIQPTFARQATPSDVAEFPTIDIEISDTGFRGPPTITAGRTMLSVTNTGTMAESHWAIGRFPDTATEAEIEEFWNAQNDTEALGFEDIAFVGVPDWPKPGGAAVTGIVDLEPGRHFAFDPISGRESVRFLVEGEYAAAGEPESDLVVDLHDMAIVLADEAITSSPMRWKIENTGSIHHDVAVLPVPADFTEEHFMALMTMPEDATPPPGMPAFEYLPAAAIGILSAGGTSWLDVQLAPGRYMGVCMLPFGTGYPHAMDGMYVFFDVT
jgi:hypothetical protein